MIRRLGFVTAWLLAGQAVWLALFWTLLQVPESSALMLALSFVLAVALLLVAGWVVAGGSTAWDMARAPVPALWRGIRQVPAALAAALLFGALWGITAALLTWHAGVAGQIDAWYIARTGRSDTRWIHGAIVWMTQFVRWSVGLTLASSLLGWLVARGPAALRSTGWLRAATAPSAWLMVTMACLLLVALPWRLADWRPARLSLAAEPWFVGAKLTVIAVAISAGWALVLLAGHRAAQQATPQQTLPPD